MLASGIPAKFPIPWGNSAGGSYIRSIPTASQIGIQNGAASLTDGFPPDTFLNTSAGGVFPFGQDFNGILKQITQWNQWAAAGGPVQYDSTFSTNIGGYPKGARLLSSSGHAIWESIADNNTTDPDTGGANWVTVCCIWSATISTAAGTSNALTTTLTPAPASMSQLRGIPLHILTPGPNSGAVTLNVNSLGAYSVTTPAAGALVAGQSVGIITVIWDGARFELLSGAGAVPAQFPSSLATAGYKKIPDPNAPSGFWIEQWGYNSITISATTTWTKASVTYPISFPNACLNVRATQATSGVGTTVPLNSDGSNALSLEGLILNRTTALTGFDMWGFDSTDTGKQDIQWIAVGY